MELEARLLLYLVVSCGPCDVLLTYSLLMLSSLENG